VTVTKFCENCYEVGNFHWQYDDHMHFSSRQLTARLQAIAGVAGAIAAAGAFAWLWRRRPGYDRYAGHMLLPTEDQDDLEE